MLPLKRYGWKLFKKLKSHPLIKNFQWFLKPLGKKLKISMTYKAWCGLVPGSLPTSFRTILPPSFNAFALTQAPQAASISGHLDLLFHLNPEHLPLVSSMAPILTSSEDPHQPIFSYMPLFSPCIPHHLRYYNIIF